MTKFKEAVERMTELVNKHGKDDVKFTVIGIHWAPNSHYYYDNCIKLNHTIDYEKGERTIKAVLYDGTLKIITRPAQGAKELKEGTLSEDELHNLVLEVEGSID